MTTKLNKLPLLIGLVLGVLFFIFGDACKNYPQALAQQIFPLLVYLNLGFSIILLVIYIKKGTTGKGTLVAAILLNLILVLILRVVNNALVSCG